jgi:hypothetical protein
MARVDSLSTLLFDSFVAFEIFLEESFIPEEAPL